MLKPLPVMRPKLPEFSAVAGYLASMDESRVYSNRGPLLRLLEKRLSLFFGVSEEKLVVCANATLALQGAAFLMPARTFHAPAFTFPATLTAIINTGKNLNLCDIRDDDWTISNQGLLIDGNSALVEVLPFGAPFNPFKNLEWNYCIIDAAASTGSDRLDLSNLNDNWVIVFSLHATKVLGIGEGGVAIFGSKSFADEFRAWINFGFSGSRISALPGINGKMSEISAAYGLATLDQWTQEKSEWSDAKESSIVISRDLGIESITSRYSGVSPYWIADFGSQEIANRVETVLAEKAIATRRWWNLGCHKMEAFKNFSVKEFPVTDQVASRTLGLPLYRDIRARDFTIILNALTEALGV